uniref:CAP, isoform AB n=1 Tax=Drosophila melanogaster TaxID=7227 RepID=A0A6M3Q831_DROME|nr:CAP, isoform AB [Drosophila melanogaster]QJC18697.1 CAP, isoform AB [Drosophila melanogaster]
MPNNRNRNRNRNRNKRNRNQNQNQNPSQNQNENHQQQAEGAEDREEQQDFQTQIAVAQSSSFVDDNGNSGSVSNGPTENSEEVTNTLEKTEKKEEIFEQPATVIQKEADSDAEMGAKNSKHRKEKSDKQASNGKSEEQVRPPPTIIRRPPGSPRQAKVIVHRIVREEDTANGKAQSPEPPKAVESKEQHMEVEDSKKEKPEAQQEIETKEERENEPSPKELPESSHLSEDAQQKHVEVEENQQVYDEVDYSKDETTDNNPQQEQHDSKEPEQYVLQLEKAMEFVENAHQQHVAAVQSYQKQRDTEQNAQQQEQNEAQHLQESTKAHQQNIAVPQILVDPKKREEGLAQQLHHDVKEEPILNNAQQQNDDTAPKSPKEVTIKVQFQTEDPYSQQPPPQKPTSKVIIHQIHVETTDEEQNAKPTFEEVSSTTGSLAGTLSPPPRYLVESPKNVSSGQFSNFSRNVQIQEMELNSDFSSGEFNSLQSPLVCEVDSESEGSVVLGPERSPSDQQVPSSSRVEQHEQVRQKRAQYRNALESHFMPQLLNPRYLDSILEENEWRNSTASSGGSDQTGIRTPKLNETFPRSQLDFSRRHKRREEAPSPLKLETKLLEESTDLESCTRLQSALSPQSEDAELVYLSSSASSSVSDLMELELEQAAALAERALVDLDTDASRLIARPDDEMSSTSTTTADRSETEAETETETEREGEQSRESTPVNANPTLASSQSSLLSAATPTPTPTPTPADREQLAKDTNVSGGSTVSFGAASPLAATREEFVRNMDKVRELIEMTRREQEQGELPRSPSPPPVPPPPASVPPYSPESSSFHLASLQLKRQESNDSHCSDSTTHSQCTAINLASPPPPPTAQPPTPPLRQKPAPPPVPQPVSPPAPPTPQSEPELSVADSVANANADVDADADTDTEAIKKLRLLCTEQLASMPYGEQVLEELASVAQNISDQSQNKMPYPMPQLPHIKELQLNANESKSSSAWLGLPTQSDPKLLVCLSPGQRDLVNNQTQPDDLLDAHQKFVERRGYHELSKAQVLEQDHQQQQSEMLKTAAMMRELRKSLSPPAPPVPPPPVPVKSAETAAKATAHENAKRDDASEQKQKIAACESSSLENKPRRAADLGAQQSAEQRQSSSTTTSSHKATTETMSSDTAKFPTLDSMESELARMFPQHKGDIFEEQRKRFSNIEFPSHQPVSQTKRYSNIETSSYESKKRMENGQVVYDVSTSSHEKKEQGDPPKDQPVPPVPPPPIMSATKLNGNTFIDGDVAPKNSQPSRESGSGSGNGTYEEFRQRAKAAADAFGEQREQQNGLDQDRVFKDFDRLSQQMHAELQSTREKREKSASMYDLSGFTRPASGHPRLDELQQRRHAHMQELEREIERSAKSRQERMSSVPRQMEATPPRTHEIPIELEPRSRRAESLCNLNEPPPRPHTTVGHYNHPVVQDDWSRYANDLGYSENIARPFAREVEICYQRQNQRTPHCIRAPRLSASTNDLSSSSQYSYDTFNAYGGRRTHAPMLNQAQQQQRPHYGSCYSMIERDPNPRYISTTSRRGVSPAPPPVATPQQQQVPPPAYDRQQRRSSLPRELHEQQLKYILSKEEELKFEVERLQQERRRLMEEMQRAPVLPAPQRRESYRPAAKLPTLSEDEVFRQQMAEEWMNKVAEREERRQHKIIRISKIEDEHDHSAVDKATISDEFLDRVKERRHKLSMPADSDWESGAESQPQPAAQSQPESDVEAPPVRILEGQAEANLRQLPRHLREFAKFSTSEQLPDGAQMERHEEQERREEATDNAHSSATKKTSIVKTYKVSRLPPSVQGEFPGQFSGGNRGRLYRERSQTARLVSHNIPLELTSNHSSSPDSDFNPGCGSSPAPGSSTQSSIPSLVQSPTPAPPPPIEPLNPSSSTAGGILGTALLLGLSLLTAWNKFNRAIASEEANSAATGMGVRLRPRPPKQTRFLLNAQQLQQQRQRRSWSESDLLKEIDSELQLAKGFLYANARPSYKSNGYVSEPEPNYDSDYSTVRYRTQNPHRVQSVSSAVNVRNLNQDEKLYGTMPNPIKSAQNSYKNQPGRIENYTTGHSSVSEKEKKEWWDEVMDIFNGNLEQSKLSPLYTEGNLSRALAKESGYTSDSNLVFRKKEVPVSSPLSPVEQKQAYKSLQAGGEPPLLGFRKPAPEKPRDVNIHFKTPIRHEQRQNLSEEELAIRQAEHMQKLYHEERRRKYLQELQDMNSRRHTDNFTPSQKSPIALNRYDDFPTDVTLKSLVGPKTVARALFNFQGQTSKELSFRKGDTIYIRRQIDANWYEGEHNAMIGLLPASYVEIVSRDGARTPSKRPSEGQARAKYNFQAQSGIELSLNKGELVTLTRRVDGNWFEGKIANRKGIFPCSYVEVLTDIGAEDIAARTTTVITSQSTTNLRPNLDVLRTNINNEFNTLTQNGAQPPNGILKETRTLHKTDALHVDTSSEPLAYRALYKYRPQNSDELELLEGDVVHVLEKCDDGWFVGTSQRTGCFGTFPGNYVERA